MGAEELMKMSESDWGLDPRRPLLFNCPKCEELGEPSVTVMMNHRRELVPEVKGYCLECDFKWRALPGRSVLLMPHKPGNEEVNDGK